MNMAPERFDAIIEAYGSRPERWPAEERPAALAYLNSNPQAQALVASYSALDDLLDEYRVEGLTSLQQHVLVQTAIVSESTILDRVFEWLLPRSERVLAWFWRPALLACLPLLCGLYLGNHFSFGIDGTQHSWEEEMFMLSLNDYAEPLQ